MNKYRLNKAEHYDVARKINAIERLVRSIEGTIKTNYEPNAWAVDAVDVFPKSIERLRRRLTKDWEKISDKGEYNPYYTPEGIHFMGDVYIRAVGDLLSFVRESDD